ncbi:protein BONZAI 1 isoform X2 [Cryptomeria japonica]|uniref:protein BONZAI 1 isoform X2 n=2 Tax=Cryptomeria japonica TaxID=3369 RepID=UPI0025AB707E|nr:protein BONZAI 1 isoform X2 [Cryptomeria japonica]
MGAHLSSDTAGGRVAVGGGRARGHGNQDHANEATSEAYVAVENLMVGRRGFRLPSSQLELSLSASNLRDRDFLSKSDPMAVVYMKKQDGSLEELGRTEVILNSLDPVWITKLRITYYFEILQLLTFRLYDVDTKFHNVPTQMLRLDEQQFLGEADCFLSEIVTKPGKNLTKPLKGATGHTGAGQWSQKFGNITLQVEETINSKMVVEMVLRSANLENKEIFSKSDPFLKISRPSENGNYVPVCKTEVKRNNLNPIWKPVTLSLQQAGSMDNPLMLECYDFNNSGNHYLMGRIQKSLTDLENLSKSKSGENFYMPTSSKRDGPNKILKSQLFVEKFSMSTKHSFLDYITNGYELNFMVAIDFTASNGNPRLPDSLHYIDPSGRLINAYQRAIMSVGEVLEFYDTDKKFPAWGFGGRPIDGPVSHCFNLSGSDRLAEVEGIAGIMSAYSSALKNVALAGPTLFGQVINCAASIAGQHAEQRKYYVLLIITDGVITDLQETKDSIVKASDLPLSILIVGVGGADFKEMEILDADKGDRLESSTGRVATRDIVQFVPMRDLPTGETIAQSLLAELPMQFLSYMKSRSIEPFVD